jgi:undecaprenyl diphosphate synthase
MQEQVASLDNLKIPHHLAVIMDGNGRWAQNHGKLRVSGHQEGANAVRRIITESAKMGVKELTLFAFSSENWKRPALEVNALMTLFVKAIRQETLHLLENGICTKIIGDKNRFPLILQKQIAILEDTTKDCNVMRLNIAANYGGRWEILKAAKTLMSLPQERRDNLDEEKFSALLDIPCDVDLLIRTGGEQRISNFLLWQCAYAEIFFSKTLWPDFGKDDLLEAFTFFSGRERRFGMTSEQVRNKGLQ